MGIVVAQYYSDAISDNVKRRFEQKLRDGEWIGMAPTGYKNSVNGAGKKWIEIDAFKAEGIREGFKLYASGQSSLLGVAKLWRSDYGIPANTSKVDQVLKNPFYYGEMRVKGQLYSHKYDRIISYDLFKEAEAVRNGYKVKMHRWGGLPYIYRGLIKCADCGCRITFEKKKGKYIYGHCTQSKGKHKASYVSEDLLTAQLAKLFKSIQIPAYAYEQVSEALRAAHEDKKALHYKTVSSLDSEIEKYQKRIEKVYEDYLDDKIPEDLYKRKFEEFRNSQKNLQNKRINIEQIDDEYYGSVTHLLKLSRAAPKLFEEADIEQKRSLINIVFSNLRLDGDLLRYEIEKPFDTIIDCTKGLSWLTTVEEVITMIKQDSYQLLI